MTLLRFIAALLCSLSFFAPVSKVFADELPDFILEIGPLSKSRPDLEVLSPAYAQFSPSQLKLYIHSAESRKTLVYSTSDFAKLKSISHTSDNLELAPSNGVFSHYGAFLWLSYGKVSKSDNSPGAIGLLNTSDDTIYQVVKTTSPVSAVAVNASSTRLAVALPEEQKVEIYDISKPYLFKSEVPLKLGEVSWRTFTKAKALREKCPGCATALEFLADTNVLVIATPSVDSGLSLIDIDRMAVSRNLNKVAARSSKLLSYKEFLYFLNGEDRTVNKVSVAELIKATQMLTFSPKFIATDLGSAVSSFTIANDTMYVAMARTNSILTMGLDFANPRKFMAPAFPVSLDIARDQLVVASQSRELRGKDRVWLYALSSGASYKQKGL